MKKKLLLIYVSLYLSAITWFMLFWGANYDHYVKFKGDEFFECVEVLIPGAYVLFLLLMLTVKRIYFALFLLLPVLIAVGSFFVGIIILLICRLGSTPSDIIYVYCTSYALATLTSIWLFWWQKLRRAALIPPDA